MSAVTVLPTPASELRLHLGSDEAPYPAPSGISFHGIVGQSEEMIEMYRRIDKVSRHYRNALVLGETGVGKELVARALHDLSPARAGHFVIINCSAVVETLFESELFGHARGAFTGADRDKMGLFEFAHGGTLLLDEVGDMPLATQAKLLRTLQTQEVQRVGSLTGRKVDVRVIAATNKDLRRAVAAREFREDLYYRLSMVEIAMPPLRERDGDLPLLIEHFTRRWSERFDKPVGGFDQLAFAALNAHIWPGNVRELENVSGHACMMTGGDTKTCADLPAYLLAARGGAVTVSGRAEGRLRLPETISPMAADLLEEVELRLICHALEESEWNQTHAARVLRTTRDRLRYKMKKYGIAGTPPPARPVAAVLDFPGSLAAG